METSACCSARPSQPPSLVGSWCSHLIPPSGRACAYPQLPQPLAGCYICPALKLGLPPSLQRVSWALCLSLQAFQMQLVKLGLGKGTHVLPPSHKIKGFKLQASTYALFQLH